jgi:DNA-directed RNA polymerase specialized sigma24 family protein/CheY-like chemotaxis protein
MADLAEILLEQLPYLRRYARALTGSQSRGDEYVRVCVEAILEEPERIDPSDSRAQIYRTFHQVWSVLRGADADEPLGSDATRQGRVRLGLANLAPVERQALLLVALEEFSFEDAGYILGLTEDEARNAYQSAREEIQQQASVPVLIIEDERLIAMDLSRIVEAMGHTVCAIADREEEAIEAAARTNPALVLADIQLKDGDSGIIAVQEILKRITVPVVFVTGYPERLLTGERLEPAFLVTKPFEEETLKVAIGQALSA